MKKLKAFFLVAILLTFAITINPVGQSFAVSLEDEATLQKQLTDEAIVDAFDSLADEKSFKKIEKAQKEFEKGNIDFEEGDFKKAIKHYDKALKEIQKTLNEPHSKKMKIKSVDEASADFSHPPDGIDDVYIKIKNSGKPDKPLKVELKISDLCVDGATAEEAGMKMAFMKPGKFITNDRITDEGFHVTNKWFKKYDDNKQIDRFEKILTFFSLPPTGDDMIQTSPDEKKDSFKFKNKIKEIGKQSGWDGEFEIKGDSGDYELLLFFKILTSEEKDSCDLISAGAIPITIHDQNASFKNFVK